MEEVTVDTCRQGGEGALEMAAILQREVWALQIRVWSFQTLLWNQVILGNPKGGMGGPNLGLGSPNKGLEALNEDLEFPNDPQLSQTEILRSLMVQNLSFLLSQTQIVRFQMIWGGGR